MKSEFKIGQVVSRNGGYTRILDIKLKPATAGGCPVRTLQVLNTTWIPESEFRALTEDEKGGGDRD